MTLSDYASWASILSLPLSVVLWFFTREAAAKFWKDWLGWIIIGAIILGLLASWHMGWLSWLTKPITWPVWGLILLGIGGCILALLCWFVVKMFDEQPIIPMQLDWHNYTHDEIFGVRWNWSYVGNQISDQLSVFCPRQNCCKCRLKSELNNNARFNPGKYYPPISLVCSHCGFKQDYDCDFESLKRDVLFEIERRINTKEFLKHLENK